MKKTLLFILPNLQEGGAERNLINVARHLSESFHVHLSVVNNVGPLSKELGHHIRLHDLGGRFSFFYSFPRLVRQIRPDYILSTLWDLNILVSLMGWIIPSKTQIILREAIMPTMIRYETKIPTVVKVLYKLAYRKADHIIALTQSMKRAFIDNISIPENRVSVIYNAVDQKRLINDSVKRKAPDDAVLNFISMGRLSYQKGFDVLLKALAEVVKHYNNIHLTIYGVGRDRKRLEGLIEKLSLTNKATLAGYTSNPIQAITQADLYILSSRYEGLSNAALEALCSGVPVVAVNDNNSADEIICDGENGILVSRCSVEAIAQGLLRAIDGYQYFDCSKIKREAIERFSLDKQIDQYINLIKQLHA